MLLVMLTLSQTWQGGWACCPLRNELRRAAPGLSLDLEIPSEGSLSPQGLTGFRCMPLATSWWATAGHGPNSWQANWEGQQAKWTLRALGLTSTPNPTGPWSPPEHTPGPLSKSGPRPS